jgi:DNA-binding response OmpR family regulator
MQEIIVKMIRALYLTAQTDPILSPTLQLLTSKCEEVQVASTLAQATTLLNETVGARNLDAHHFDIILADVYAGGLTLAEYLFRSATDSQNGNGNKLKRARPKLLMMDERGDIVSARRALRLGVDDYFLNRDDLSTRLDALFDELRFRKPENPVDRTDAGRSSHTDNPNAGVAFNLDSLNETWLNRLSSVEAAIVNCLTSQMGSPLSARSIVHLVMGRDMDEDRAASLIRPHISRLRSKVEPLPQMPQRLLTVRGKGYMFVC